MVVSASNGYTPTQRRILAVLADGLCHSAEELRGCLEDDLAGPTALRYHISEVRHKLEQRGQSIVFRSGGYRQVRLLPLSE